MKKSELKVELDIQGNPFVVDACITDGESKKQSTMEYLQEEFYNIGEWRDVGVPLKAGVYSLRVIFTPPDDVENIFRKIK